MTSSTVVVDMYASASIHPKLNSASVLIVKGLVAHGALHKYMHGFHADRDHAMCNIQNRSIAAVQKKQLQNLSNKKNFQGTGVSQKLMPSASVQSGSTTIEVPG
jgi:hypothetical protein